MPNETGIRAHMDKLFKGDAAGGIVLMLAAAFAIILANSPLDWLYNALLSTPFKIQLGELKLDKPLLLWINDGLMAVFFFLVGLEIKRELVLGRLSSWQQASLPAIAAAGGMIVPAIIYIVLNLGNGETLNGWAIPAATDIAFALGVLALLGDRVPTPLKVFLLALAVIDDLGAIVIIAVAYTSDLSVLALGLGLGCLAVLIVMNLIGVTKVTPFILLGVVMWVCVLKSGVHATLAGVVLAFTIPLKVPGAAEDHSPLEELEHALAPWVAFMVMPIFAFANAGVSLSGLSVMDLFAPVPLGIALGLFLGKQIGVMGFIWGGMKARICAIPDGVTFLQMYGVALLAGIGFTMSLFIGTLAFSSPEFATDVRLGVLSGSILSGIVGYTVLRFALSSPGEEVAQQRAAAE